MGTRGHLTFVIDGTRKTTYNHWDSYPEGLGTDVLGWLRAAAIEAETVAQVRALLVVDPDSTPTPEQRERLRKYANVSVGAQDIDDWYCLLRETQGSPALILECGHLFDGSNLGGIEYRYTVDFDRRVLTAQGHRDEEPKSWSFDALPSDADFVRAVSGGLEEES